MGHRATRVALDALRGAAIGGRSQRALRPLRRRESPGVDPCPAVLPPGGPRGLADDPSRDAPRRGVAGGRPIIVVSGAADDAAGGLSPGAAGRRDGACGMVGGAVDRRDADAGGTTLRRAPGHGGCGVADRGRAPGPLRTPAGAAGRWTRAMGIPGVRPGGLREAAPDRGGGGEHGPVVRGLARVGFVRERSGRA